MLSTPQEGNGAVRGRYRTQSPTSLRMPVQLGDDHGPHSNRICDDEIKLGEMKHMRKKLVACRSGYRMMTMVAG